MFVILFGHVAAAPVLCFMVWSFDKTVQFIDTFVWSVDKAVLSVNRADSWGHQPNTPGMWQSGHRYHRVRLD